GGRRRGDWRSAGHAIALLEQPARRRQSARARAGAVVRGAALFILCATLGCSAGEPGGFGVNLRINTGTLGPDVVNAIVDGHMIAGGDEPFDTVFSFQQALRSGMARLRYIPGIHTGNITITIAARDTNARVLAVGGSGMIALMEGKASPANITLVAP